MGIKKIVLIKCLEPNRYSTNDSYEQNAISSTWSTSPMWADKSPFLPSHALPMHNTKAWNLFSPLCFHTYSPSKAFATDATSFPKPSSSVVSPGFLLSLLGMFPLVSHLLSSPKVLPHFISFVSDTII